MEMKLLDFLITFIESLLIIKIIDLFFKKKRSISIATAFVISIMSYIFLYIIKDVNIVSFLIIFLTFIYAFLNLKGLNGKKIIIIIFVYTSLMLINMSVVIVSDILGLDLQLYYLQQNTNYILIICIQKFFFFIEYLILKNIVSKENIMTNKISILTAALFIFSIILTEIVISKYITSTALSDLDFLAFITIIIIICFLVFRIYMNIMKEYKIYYEEKLLYQTYSQEERILELLNKKIEEMNRLNHDFDNHKMVIEKLGNNHNKCYLEDYLESYKTFYYVDTNNLILNYIVNEKIEIGKKLNINIKCILEGNFQNSIADIDLCVLLGNLLDNSITAAKDTEKKYILLKMKQDDYKLVVVVENSYNEICFENGNYFSTKNFSNSGFGIANIKNICEKYNGINSIKHSNDIFTNTCILFLE